MDHFRSGHVTARMMVTTKITAVHHFQLASSDHFRHYQLVQHRHQGHDCSRTMLSIHHVFPSTASQQMSHLVTVVVDIDDFVDLAVVTEMMMIAMTAMIGVTVAMDLARMTI